MRFRTDDCAKHFVTEVGRFDLIECVDKDWEPNEDMQEDLIKKRRPVFNTLKSHFRSSASKSSWRANRTNIMRGIKAFHRSTAGKRFHKDMGRFLVRKIFSPLTQYRNQKAKMVSLSITEKADVLKAISSMKTHIIIESGFYQGIYEQYGLDWMVKEGSSLLNSIEEDILQDNPITDDLFELLVDMTESTSLINSLANEYGVKNKEVESIWNTIKTSLKDQGRSEEDEGFYPILVSAVKKALEK